ncbi:peptidylprolyl isomerase [Planktothrix pseudagardhii]|uniref:peptidylprolyl isomerase n=1 Tax=Planktothrix pseudagardhii TaxID=132604 RepID=A0A9W4CKG4_9CYAN|nr:Foldase protein PrsA [Planktothrix pseudagardhii]
MIMVQLSKDLLDNEEIISFLKRNLEFKEVYQKILSQKVINQVAEERGIIVTAEEIQNQANQQRYAKRLEKAADTLAWLADQMITSDDWEAGIREHLLAQKLAESLFTKDVEKYFIQNRLNFEQVSLYQIIVPYERLARELFYQIEEEEISFYHAAHLYDIEPGRRERCGYEGQLYRWGLKADFAAIVFAATPGEILSPVKTDQGYHLILVEEFIQAELTIERTQEIIQKLFKDWLASELNYRLYNA